MFIIEIECVADPIKRQANARFTACSTRRCQHAIRQRIEQILRD